MVKFSEYLTKNPSQTKKLGEILAKEVLKTLSQKNALTFGLTGDLGGGKTTFLQGFAKGLGIKEKILSPTFIILRKFEIRNSTTTTHFQWTGSPSPFSRAVAQFKTFYHIDCYKVEKEKEILGLGFKEIISNPRNIVAIEWADRIRKILPPNTIWIKFDFISRNTRQISIKKVRGKKVRG